MNTKDILKVLATRFYLNIDLDKEVRKYSDEEYDGLVSEYETSTGESVKSLVDWDFNDKIWRDPLDPLLKTAYDKSEIRDVIRSEYGLTTSCRITYKYDGCSVEANYSTTGRLMSILGTPDSEFGFIRTNKLRKFFPEQITPGVHRLFGEVLVDAENYGQRARNKANGLCNSKDMQEEVDSEVLVRVYNATFYDGDNNFYRINNLLDSLEPKKEVRGDKEVTIFSQAEKLTYEDITAETLVKEKDGISTVQIDGYVVYSPQHGAYGYKLYYTESEVVTLDDIIWQRNESNGSWAPVGIFNTVVLNDKNISKVSLGGVQKMISERRGVGAVVSVALSGGTIPQIIEVLEPSEDYNLPKCECGYQMTLDDIYGSVLKCSADDCSYKLGIFENLFMRDITYDQLKRLFISDPNSFAAALSIDRFNPYARTEVISKAEYCNRVICECMNLVSREAITEYAKVNLVSDNLDAVIDDIVDSLEGGLSDEEFDELSIRLQESLVYSENTTSKEELALILNNISEVSVEELSSRISSFIYNNWSLTANQKRNASIMMYSFAKYLKQKADKKL